MLVGPLHQITSVSECRAFESARPPDHIGEQLMTAATNRDSIFNSLMPKPSIGDMVKLQLVRAWFTGELGDAKEFTKLAFVVV